MYVIKVFDKQKKYLYVGKKYIPETFHNSGIMLDSQYDLTFEHLSQYLNGNTTKGLLIFDNEKNAKLYFGQNVRKFQHVIFDRQAVYFIKLQDLK